MKAKYPGTCGICGYPFSEGDDIAFLPAARLVNAPNPYYGEIHGSHELRTKTHIVKATKYAHARCVEEQK